MQRQGGPRKGPEHIGTILDSLFKEQRIVESIRVSRAVVEWELVVGEDVSRHARAVHVDHGTLVVEVESPAWMHRVQMQEWELRTRLNRHLQEDLIRQIRFRLGSPPPQHVRPGSEPEEEKS